MVSAIILAGGLGTRLRPLTYDIPKCMVPVDGKPFLEYLVLLCRREGITDLVMSIGYLGDQIISHFGDGSEFGVSIRYSKEKKLLGTGGAIKFASRLLGQDETFVAVLNGDTFFDVDFQKLISFHTSHSSLLTIALSRVDDVSRYGSVELASDGAITRFCEKQEGGGLGYINAGVCVVNSRLLTSIPDGVVSFERDVMPKHVGKRIYGVTFDGYFVDMGTVTSLQQVRSEVDMLNAALQWEQK